MPRSLPWFNGNIDPLLPNIIKPLLYGGAGGVGDDYQTYDLLLWGRVYERLKLIKMPGYGKIPQKPYFYNTSNFFVPNLYDQSRIGGMAGNSPYQGVFFDRYTPWQYPWCDEYATKAFYFVDKFAASDYYRGAASYPDGYEVPATDAIAFWGLEDAAPLLDLTAWYPLVNGTTLTLNIPATKQRQEIYLTWMQQEDKFYTEWVKRYIKYLTTDKSQIVKFTIPANILCCSMVVSATEPQLEINLNSQVYAQSSKGLLYSNLDALFDEISVWIKTRYPRLKLVIDSVEWETKATVSWEFSPYFGDASSSAFYVLNKNVPYNVTDNLKNVNYRNCPDYYKDAALFYANNDFWQNGQVYNQDLGVIPHYYDNGDYDLLRYPSYTEDLPVATAQPGIPRFFGATINAYGYFKNIYDFQVMPYGASGNAPTNAPTPGQVPVIGFHLSGINADAPQQAFGTIPGLMMGRHGKTFFQGLTGIIWRDDLSWTSYDWQVSATSQPTAYTTGVNPFAITDNFKILGNWGWLRQNNFFSTNFSNNLTFPSTEIYEYYSDDSGYKSKWQSSNFTPASEINAPQYIDLIDDTKYAIDPVSGELVNPLLSL